MKLIILLLPLISLVSCNEYRGVKKQIVDLQSSPIIINANDMVVNINGLDSIYSYGRDKNKLIVYHNTSTCNTCVLKGFYDWNVFISDISDYLTVLDIYFIFSPNKDELRNFRLSLRNLLNDYPILIDTAGIFESNNPHLPKNKAMHTFLLDEDNNVVLVGNPLHNPKIERMFKEIVEEKLGDN